ncbi:peptidoglycan-recognition protein SD-like [Fopius arisanus]|uniref:PGRP-LF protein n=1 Tax=Fopius arisanus TaxID=64838 RepID=A0A0C9QFS3_9HYME|nr:PREDICTED: peptidoglycan-recognition protein SD-like [Fopius arisanus]
MAQNITILIRLVMAVAEAPQLAITIELPNPSSSTNLTTTPSPPLTAHDPVKMIGRGNWGAQPPLGQSPALEMIPTPYVIIGHTGTKSCSTEAECSQKVRLIQSLHTEGNKWDDIGYNFLVGGDGNIYVGRGWNVEGVHTFNYNKKSIGVGFIGTFNDLAPNEKQLRAAQQLLELGVKFRELTSDYKLLGQRQVISTISPGEQLYGIIQTWPHWSATP